MWFKRGEWPVSVMTVQEVQTVLYILQADVLVCAKGGGGLLKERMALVADLWAAWLRAKIVADLATPDLNFVIGLRQTRVKGMGDNRVVPAQQQKAPNLLHTAGRCAGVCQGRWRAAEGAYGFSGRSVGRWAESRDDAAGGP